MHLFFVDVREMLHFTNLTHQMVCFIEPSEKSFLETVWKRASIFKIYLADDCMNHLSITNYHHLPYVAAGFVRSQD